MRKDLVKWIGLFALIFIAGAQAATTQTENIHWVSDRDSNAPTVTIFQPVQGDIVSEVVNIDVYLNDDNAIKSAWVDANVGACFGDQNLTISPLPADSNLTWNSNGAGCDKVFDVNIVAHAEDYNNHVSVDWVVVKVDNTEATFNIEMHPSNIFKVVGRSEFTLNAIFDRNVSIYRDLNVQGNIFGQRTYGEIYAHEVSDTITTFDENVAVQITSFNENGYSNNTVPDHTNNHITVEISGIYLVNASVSFKAAQSNLYEFHVGKDNNTTLFHNLHANRTTANAGASGSVSISGLASITKGETIEIWVARQSGGAPDRDIVISNANLTLTNIG